MAETYIFETVTFPVLVPTLCASLIFLPQGERSHVLTIICNAPCVSTVPPTTERLIYSPSNTKSHTKSHNTISRAFRKSGGTIAYFSFFSFNTFSRAELVKND